ncbi:MAG TPA: glucose-1-phosphate adenylyltransferase [Gemmataceae bacterium]|jgi:glucose-1-phosphate adenylyltransferase|nr:glucose-1-phosphate adenylyltransferase [Gemmataceae bacterium]
MQDVLALILGGGRGTHLYPLTKTRSVPALPIAGKYRLIDMPVSNCLNSGLRRIYVLTQFQSASLHRHLANAYKFDPFSRGFVSILAAQQTNEAAAWYEGTADAVRKNLRYVEEDGCRDVLILSSDQLYRMDYGEMIRRHRESAADVTLAVQPVTRDEASRLGILRVAPDWRVIDLLEKPRTADQFDRLRTPVSGLNRNDAPLDHEYLANMGIYAIRRDVLLELLQSQASDLVVDIFARVLKERRVLAHLHTGYWQDVGSIKSYYEASLALTHDPPPFDFHTTEGVIYTSGRNLPASHVRASRVHDCLVADGCMILPGANLHHSIVGVRSRIGRDVVLRDAIVIGADVYETEAQRQTSCAQGIPPLGIGDHSRIERAILDKDCRIGCNVQIVNRQNLQHADEATYVIRDGIVVIPRGTVVPDGTVI